MSAIAFPSSPAYTAPTTSPDDLATVVLRRLEKRPPGRSWGLIRTVVVAVSTFGLLPLMIWASRFREYVADETLTFQELAQWAKLRGRQPAAIGPLIAAADMTAPGTLPYLLSRLLSVFVIVVFAIQFTHVPMSVDQLLDWTYAYHLHLTHGTTGAFHAQFVHRVWIIALSIGFSVQLLEVWEHQLDVRRFVERFNPVAEADGLPPVRYSDRQSASFIPLWILTAILFAKYGALWGIPMVLAGITQRRYTWVTGRNVRRELAKRVRDIVALRQLPIVSARAVITRRCPNSRCLAPLRRQGKYCMRCGTDVVEEQSS